MSGKLPQLKRADFTLKKVKIEDDGLIASFTGVILVKDKKETINYDNISASYLPHEDLIYCREQLKPFLFQAFNLHVGFDLAEKYLTSGKLAKVKEERAQLMEKVNVTSVTIVGSDQLKGAKITGTQESWNETNCSTSAPTVTYSSEKIGIEKEVQKIAELLESEVYKYFFEGKSADKTLFDDGDDNGAGKVRDLNVKGAETVDSKKVAAEA